jgi:putative flippase GtrA
MKLTVLTSAMLVLLIYCVYILISNYNQLADNGGWGLISLGGLIFASFVGIGLDVIIGFIVKNKMIQNIIGAVIALVFLYWLWPQL